MLCFFVFVCVQFLCVYVLLVSFLYCHDFSCVFFVLPTRSYVCLCVSVLLIVLFLLFLFFVFIVLCVFVLFVCVRLPCMCVGCFFVMYYVLL